MLNYFNTTGEDWVAAGRTRCTFFNDRAGDPVTDNNCSDNGPRGAAESSGGTDLTDPKADLERQRAKEVKAINTMDADILSLEEIENSAALGETDRDDALKSLVDALNADAGSTRWAYAPSPSAADLPPLAQQDVIRTAFIYNPSKVSLVGASKVLSDESGDGQPFANAREPLAQEFKRKGALDSDGFLVVVNHFKSKGDSTRRPPATTPTASRAPSTATGSAQAHALVDFAKATAQADAAPRRSSWWVTSTPTPRRTRCRCSTRTGSSNQPQRRPARHVVRVRRHGRLARPRPGERPAAANMVTGRDVWQINAEESVALRVQPLQLQRRRCSTRPTSSAPPTTTRSSSGLDAPFTQQASTVTVTATPDRIKKKRAPLGSTSRSPAHRESRRPGR